MFVESAFRIDLLYTIEVEDHDGQIILLRATDLGLGAVWCGIHPQQGAEDNVRACLGLDKKEIPLNVIFIGHPSEEPDARDQYDEERIHFIV